MSKDNLSSIVNREKLVKLLLIFVFSIFSPIFAFSSEISIENTIQQESALILYHEFLGKKDTDAMGLYNERGISYFFYGDYYNALKDFDVVIEKYEKEDNFLEPIVETAWYGKMFCHAYLGLMQEVWRDIRVIKYIMSQRDPCPHGSSTKFSEAISRGHFSRSILRTELWPENQPMSSWECVATVKNTAWALQLLAEKIPQYGVRVVVTRTIDEMKDAAMDCCYRGGLWSACLKPMADKLQLWNQKWKTFGIPPNPAWD